MSQGFGKTELKTMSQNGDVERGAATATATATATYLPRHPKHKRRCKAAMVATLLVVMIVVLVGVILGVTVFRVREPKTQLVSSSIEGVAPRVSFPAIKIELNMTLNLTLQVHNPNYASFRGGQGQSVLTYQSYQVGEADLNPGLIPSRGTSTLSILLTLEVDRFANSGLTSLINDIMAGQLHMGTKTRVPGRVHFLGIFRKHIVSTSDCQFVVEFPDLKIKNRDCKNHIKL